MEKQVPDIPVVKDGLERFATGCMIAGTVLGGVAVESLERFTARVRDEWKPPHEPNTELGHLAEVLDEAGVEAVDATKPYRGHLDIVQDDGSLESDRTQSNATILAPTAPELEPLLLPHEHPDPHTERPAEEGSFSLYEAGIGAATHAVGATRWLAGKALSLAKKPIEHGVSLDPEQVQELALSQTEQEVTKHLAQHIEVDRLPAINNLATVLVAELMRRQDGQVNPARVEERFVRILTATAGVPPQKARLALRQWGPQRMLRQ